MAATEPALIPKDAAFVVVVEVISGEKQREQYPLALLMQMS